MRELFESSENADVEIQLQDGQISSHKLILTTRVAYFRRLFAAGMQEAQINEIKINDFRVAEFRVFMEYVYTGTIRSSFDTKLLPLVMKIADKYNLRDCFNHCLEHLRLRIQCANSRLGEFTDAVKPLYTRMSPIVKHV